MIQHFRLLVDSRVTYYHFGRDCGWLSERVNDPVGGKNKLPGASQMTAGKAGGLFNYSSTRLPATAMAVARGMTSLIYRHNRDVTKTGIHLMRDKQ